MLVVDTRCLTRASQLNRFAAGAVTAVRRHTRRELFVPPRRSSGVCTLQASTRNMFHNNVLPAVLFRVPVPVSVTSSEMLFLPPRDVRPRLDICPPEEDSKRRQHRARKVACYYPGQAFTD